MGDRPDLIVALLFFWMAATRPYGETFWGKPFYLPSRPERKVEAPVPVYPVGKTEGRKIPGSKLPPLHYDPFVEYDEYKNELQSFHSSVGYQHVGLLLEEVLRDQLASWPKWSVSSLVGRIYSFSKEPRGDVKILELLGPPFAMSRLVLLRHRMVRR